MDSTVAFQAYITHWYQLYGRHDLPWRKNYSPYPVLVSELMLQQTQVSCVVPKFNAFLDLFSSVQVLAQAPLSKVLIAWQGLGYNRRAKFLHQTAQQVTRQFNGIFPQTKQELLALPGIGPYTADAILAFSFNQPVTVIETNIRAVFLHHFFPDKINVSDDQLEPLITTSIDKSNPRRWYSALMDYGSHLKSVLPNPSRNSKHHTKQSKFEGSSRQVRGEILRILTQTASVDKKQLKSQLTSNTKYFSQALKQLLDEELVLNDSNIISLAK